ncbi:MAG: tetraacyldisaccharide 4'-kinase, partial [Candidatus Omnitrophica bacterium]|nr:tetraacyldisaccharide 4'-kinase [Candidatus Omnitrophota bacterium]
NGWMLPGGVLREGPASLGRAGVVVLSKDDPASRNVAALEARVRRFNPDALLLSAQLKPECFEVWGQDRRQPLAEWNGTRAGIFSGIADPAAFEQSLRQLGVTPVFHKKFLDHHRYEKQAIDRLVLECQRLNAVALMTTLKDAVRIPQEWLKNLPVPVVVLHVNLELTREEDLIERLHSVLGR